MRKEIINNKITFYDENNNEIMFIDYLNNECIVWFIKNNNIIVNSDTYLYEALLKLLNSLDKLILFSECNCDKLFISNLTIEKRNNYIKLYCDKPVDKYFIRDIKSHVMIFYTKNNYLILNFYNELLNKKHTLTKE